MQLDHHTIPVLQRQYYNAAGIHVGIDDLPNSSSRSSIHETCDIIKIALRCRSHNITTIFVSCTASSTKVNLQLIHNLNGLLYYACTKYGFNFVDNDAVTSGKMPFTCGNFLAKWLLQVTLLAALFFREYDSTHQQFLNNANQHENKD